MQQLLKLLHILQDGTPPALRQHRIFCAQIIKGKRRLPLVDVLRQQANAYGHNSLHTRMIREWRERSAL